MQLFEDMGLDPDSAEDYGTEGLKANMIPQLGSLQLIYDPTQIYIPFVDNEVKQICVSNWGDGTGITYTQAASVSSLYQAGFAQDTSIIDFKELIYFTGVTYLAGVAFKSTSNLEVIGIPSSVTATDTNVFQGCLKVNKIYITDLNAFISISWNGQNAHPFGPSGATGGTLYLNDEPVTNVNFPSTMTQIKSYCLVRCKSITSVTIPSSITSIGEGAFLGCSNLTSITIPSSVTVLGPNAFNGCTGLTSVTILGNV